MTAKEFVITDHAEYKDMGERLRHLRNWKAVSEVLINTALPQMRGAMYRESDGCYCAQGVILKEFDGFDFDRWYATKETGDKMEHASVQASVSTKYLPGISWEYIVSILDDKSRKELVDTALNASQLYPEKEMGYRLELVYYRDPEAWKVNLWGNDWQFLILPDPKARENLVINRDTRIIEEVRGELLISLLNDGMELSFVEIGRIIAKAWPFMLEREDK